MKFNCTQFGDGVMQDFHLAKRYYDLAAEVDPKAKLPRDIALFIMDVSWKVIHLTITDNGFLLHRSTK